MQSKADVVPPVGVKTDFRMLVLTRRLKMPGLLETMTDQAPEVRRVIAKIEEDLGPSIAALDGGGWEVASHSVTVYNGLVIATFLLQR
jgi:hypothetical protein